MNKKVKKRTTKFERVLLLATGSLIVMTLFTALILSSKNLVNIRDISSTDQQIEVVKQEVSELEVRKQEKLTYEQVHAYAAAGGLEKNEERVQKVRVD